MTADRSLDELGPVDYLIVARILGPISIAGAGVPGSSTAPSR